MVIRCLLTHPGTVISIVVFSICLLPFMNFGSGIICLLCRFERKLVLLFVMGRKGKRVHEQSVGSSARSHDYETIRIIPTPKQESTVTGSTASSGISAPPGLDPPESRAEPIRPPVGSVTCPFKQKCQYCTFPCCRCDALHVLHRCNQHVNWKHFGSSLLRLEQLGSRRWLFG